MTNTRFSVSSIVLPALIVPIIMTYQIFPGDTNYIQFGLIFLALFFNFFLDAFSISDKKYYLFKYFLFWSVLLLAVGGAFVSTVIVRHNVAPVFQIHDIILQLEAAIRFFLDGINPWAATYHNTLMASWHYSDTMVNPALYHFVMMPFYLLFSLPFYYLSNHSIGYFDGRIPLFILYFIMCISTFVFTKKPENKLLFTSLLALNPAMFSYTLEGRSDVYMFAFLILGFITLTKKMYGMSGVVMALAFTVKQSVWPLLPLYVAYVYFKSRNVKLTLMRISSFFIVTLLLTLPFFLWDPISFLNSTVFYLSGNTEHSYPISGYGLGVLLHQLGIIKDLISPYPFVFWQIVIVIPLMVFLIKYLKRNQNVRTLIFTYGILLFVFWYLSRYFNNSHVGYLTMVFTTAYFWPESEKEKSKK